VKRILGTPPLVISLSAILFAIASAATGAGTFGEVKRAIYMVAAYGWILFTVIWCQAVSLGSAERVGISASLFARLVFAVASIGALIGLLLGVLGWYPPPPGDLFIVPVVLSLFSHYAVTAKRLSRATSSAPNVALTIGYFFLIVYLPIGIWFLRRQVRRVASYQDTRTDALWQS